MIWICLFTFSVTPSTLLHSVFTQNFQRLGLLWLEVEPNWAYAPRGTYAQIFLRFGLSFFFAGGGVVTCMTHLLALFTAYNCYTCLNDLISWPLYFYYEKTALKYVYSKNEHVPQNGNTRGYMYPQTEI